jgi:hypothetical protein
VISDETKRSSYLLSLLTYYLLFPVTCHLSPLLKERTKMADDKRSENSSNDQGRTPTVSKESQTGDPGRTPGKAEGDEDAADESLSEKEAPPRH